VIEVGSADSAEEEDLVDSAEEEDSAEEGDSADSAEEGDLGDSAEEEDSAVEEAKYSWKQKLLLSPKTKWLKSKTTHR
jgi:hypothetical protein